MTGTNKKWFTFTNGAHIDSLDPETYNRLYDFLSSTSRSRRRSSNRRWSRQLRRWSSRRSIGHPTAPMTLPPDPIQQQPTYEPRQGGVRGAAVDPRPVRQRRRQRRTRAGRTRGSSAPSRRFPSRAPRRAPGTSAPGGALADQPPARHGADEFTWDAHARPLTDFTGDTASARAASGPRRRDYQWTQDPAGTAVSYVTAPLSQDTAVIGAGAVDALGALVDAERRPAGDDQRGPARTARRPSCRTAGCAPRRASSTPPRARRSSRS